MLVAFIENIVNKFFKKMKNGKKLQKQKNSLKVCIINIIFHY